MASPSLPQPHKGPHPLSAAMQLWPMECAMSWALPIVVTGALCPYPGFSLPVAPAFIPPFIISPGSRLQSLCQQKRTFQMQSPCVTHLFRILSGSPLTLGRIPKHLAFKVLLHWTPTYIPSFVLEPQQFQFPGEVTLPPTHLPLSLFVSESNSSVKGLHFIPKPYTPLGLSLCGKRGQRWDFKSV